MINTVIVGHAESVWMARARAAAWCAKWLALGLTLGAAITLTIDALI